MSNKSMTDIAFEFLKENNEVPFSTLWAEVCTKLGFSQELAERKIAQFYSIMMLDARFLPLPDNRWDLKKKYRFDDTRFDTSKIVIDDDDSDDEMSLEYREDDEEVEKDSEDESFA
jgi:DNA-directed RNA polymerase subunit delta